MGVKRQFGLSGFQLGLLPALYTAGLCVASLAFAELAKHWNGFRLIGVGMALWAAGCVLTGAAQAYGMLVAARVVVGCGERGWIRVQMGKTGNHRQTPVSRRLLNTLAHRDREVGRSVLWVPAH